MINNLQIANPLHRHNMFGTVQVYTLGFTEEISPAKYRQQNIASKISPAKYRQQNIAKQNIASQ